MGFKPNDQICRLCFQRDGQHCGENSPPIYIYNACQLESGSGFWKDQLFSPSGRYVTFQDYSISHPEVLAVIAEREAEVWFENF